MSNLVCTTAAAIPNMYNIYIAYCIMHTYICNSQKLIERKAMFSENDVTQTDSEEGQTCTYM